MDNLVPLTMGVTLLACVLVVMGIHAYASGKAQRDALVDRLSTAGEIPLSRQRPFRGVDRRLRRTRFGKKLERKLAVTGLELTPGEFFVYMLATVAGLWLIGQASLAPFFGPLCGLLGVYVAMQFLNWQRQRRIERFIGQLPELARILANATQAGLALRTALSMAADELETPAGEELARVSNQLAVGHSIEDALGELAERLPSRELVVLVTTLILSSRAGGTVVGALRNLTDTLEERKETRREVRTQLSQVSMTSYAVPAMGVGALFLMNGVKDGALDRMTGSPTGQICVLVAFTLYTIGFVLIRRMSRIDV